MADGTIDTLAREWEAFKASNDARLKEIEKRGHADPLLVEKIAEQNKALDALQKQVDEVQKIAQRKTTGGGAEDERAEAKKAHAKAYGAWLRRGIEAGLRELEQKAVSTSSDPDGGYAIPETLDPVIEKYERNATPMRGACSVITVANESYEKLRQAGSAGTGWVGEDEARPESSTPTLVSLKPYFGEVYANPGATQKSLDDIFFDVEGWLAEEIGMAFGEAENLAFTSGNGVKRPRGILDYSLVTDTDSTLENNELQKVHSTSSGAFTADGLVKLVYALQSKYREGAAFMMARLAVQAVRLLKGTQNDHYMWQPGLGGQPATLLGYPVIENDDMPVPAAQSKSAIFGNFKRGYQIADVRGTRMLRDPYTNKPKVMFYATKRTGGHVVNNQALKVQVLDT